MRRSTDRHPETVPGYTHRARVVADEWCQVCGAQRGAACKDERRRKRLPHMILQRGGVTYAPYIDDVPRIG